MMCSTKFKHSVMTVLNTVYEYIEEYRIPGQPIKKKSTAKYELTNVKDNIRVNS